MNEYLRLIRDSPYLLQRSFLYNQEVDQMKDEEQNKLYEDSLQSIKELFGDEHEFADEQVKLDEEMYGTQYSPFQDVNEPM